MKEDKVWYHSELEKNWYRKCDNGMIRRGTIQFESFQMIGDEKINLEKFKSFFIKKNKNLRLNKMIERGLVETNGKKIWLTPKCVAKITAIQLDIDSISLMVLSYLYIHPFVIRSLDTFNDKFNMNLDWRNWNRAFVKLLDSRLIKKTKPHCYTINCDLRVHNDILTKIADTMMEQNKTVHDVKSTVI